MMTDHDINVGLDTYSGCCYNPLDDLAKERDSQLE